VNKPRADIAVVTSCHNYGRYLADWASSIVALDTWPEVVAIVDNGSTDGTPQHVAGAVRILQAAGFTNVLTARIPLADFGTARNEAVRLGCGTEWVMHMDVDDMFMPHCLCDVVALMPTADVIPLGYTRCGDLAAGPSNKTRVYTSTRGQSTLKSTAPASGVSPFRRALWERSPYRTDMAGGWDTALWIGFAHMDARFVAVRRPCFYYRQHADSVFNTRRVNTRRGRMVGAKLMNLRRQRHGVSVLVPRRGDGAERDAAWQWVARRYAALHPDWEVVEGACPFPGPWRKGEAVADALHRSRGDTLVVADADCVLPDGALQEAVRLVQQREAPWVVPHTNVLRLTRKATLAFTGEDPTAAPPHGVERGDLDRAAYTGFAGGGFIVVDASAWEATGGMPAAFAGWGAEDEATAVVLDTLVGPHVRLPNDLFHLWHPHARRSDTSKVQFAHNRALFAAIRAYHGDPDGMFALLHRIAAGASLDEAMDAVAGEGVLMVAIEDFKRGVELIKKHTTFIATEEEAKRHEARPRRMAVRALGGAGGTLRGVPPVRHAAQQDRRGIDGAIA
jgi:glycosyltransferase involved in cell wall biosynthesis